MLKLNFCKQLGRFRLEIDHTITARVTAVFGPSGSGKSTLLNCISGIMHPEVGEIVFLGHTLYAAEGKIRVPPEKRRFGYVFQEGHLFPHLTVQQNIAYGRPRQSSRKNQVDTAQVIDVLEIRDLLTRYPKELSVGQRQRVAMTRALASCPRMLLMDEPLAALDPGLKNRILPYLHYIKQTFDIPVLYVTHSIPEAMSFADEVVSLSDGRIIAHGEPHEVLTAPAALPIAQMTGVENIFSLPVIASDKQRGITELAIGAQKLRVRYTEVELGTRMPIAIRAQDIIVSLDFDLPISARNLLSGIIRSINVIGGQTILSVEIEGYRLAVKITTQALEHLQLEEGLTCGFIIKANAVNLLWEAQNS